MNEKTKAVLEGEDVSLLVEGTLNTKKALSIAIKKSVKDKGLASVLRKVIFSHVPESEWAKIKPVLLKHMPELKL